MGPSDFRSVNEAELLALCTGLQEADKMGVRNFIAEGDSLCAIRWASASSDRHWPLADLCDKVVVLASKLEDSFALVKRSTNGVATLAKMGK